MKLQRVGLSMFRIEAPDGQVLLTDPWISGNPTTAEEHKTPDYLRQIDALLVSHGHLDHANGVRDVAEVHPEVQVVCHFELGNVLLGEGVKNVHRLNIGGSMNLGTSKISLVPAAHSSSYGAERIYVGPATGVIVELEGGYTIYYAGDTGLTAEMKFVVGEYYNPDLAILPVGGVITMDPEQAAYAAGEFIKPRKAIPCHWFPTPETAPDQEGMLKFSEMVPMITPLMGERGQEFKSIMTERYPQIETIVLDLGEGIDL